MESGRAKRVRHVGRRCLQQGRTWPEVPARVDGASEADVRKRRAEVQRTSSVLKSTVPWGVVGAYLRCGGRTVARAPLRDVRVLQKCDIEALKHLKIG
ncbi:hypothetical protein GCM10010361_69890 [Streptomyces olivaceiscleroticus]|uniref:Integrase n=1 Tax=Streptomyces olivaceiscleroticus TaxID=68245 RepID=A0ABN1BC09_9ACTN